MSTQVNCAQVKLFVAALNKIATNRNSARFTTEELEHYARDMRLQVANFADFLDVSATELYEELR
jgi:hypothetical protein